jgi:hypothetical protein
MSCRRTDERTDRHDSAPNPRLLLSSYCKRRLWALHGMPMPMPLQVSSHHYSNIMTITSRLGIANKNKKRKVQPTLDSFFGGGTLRIAEAFDERGIRIRGCKCAYCGDWKTPQDITNHLAWYVRKGHPKNPSRANPQGRVVARVPCPPLAL